MELSNLLDRVAQFFESATPRNTQNRIIGSKVIQRLGFKQVNVVYNCNTYKPTIFIFLPHHEQHNINNMIVSHN